MYYSSDYNNFNHINFIDPYVSISYRDNRVFEGSAFQFSCGTYPPGLGAGLQLSVDGEIVNTTSDNRIFSSFDGYSLQFRIEPALFEDDGILLECVLQTPNGTFVSESSILLLVLERFSTLLGHIKVSHHHPHQFLPCLFSVCAVMITCLAWAYICSVQQETALFLRIMVFIVAQIRANRLSFWKLIDRFPIKSIEKQTINFPISSILISIPS